MGDYNVKVANWVESFDGQEPSEYLENREYEPCDDLLASPHDRFLLYIHPPDSHAGECRFFSARMLPVKQDAEITDGSNDHVVQIPATALAEVYRRRAPYVYIPTVSPIAALGDWRYAANGGSPSGPIYDAAIHRCVECA